MKTWAMTQIINSKCWRRKKIGDEQFFMCVCVYVGVYVGCVCVLIVDEIQVRRGGGGGWVQDR